MRATFRFSSVYFLVLISCATPIPPSGGAGDKQPLEVNGTRPLSGTTHFKERQVVFAFNDFPDRSSLTKAVKVVPEEIGFTVIPGRKSIIVRFNEPLPDDITVQVSLGTDAMDWKRNKMERPQVIAFSTGAVIDQGKLAGQIRSVTPGKLPEDGLIALFRVQDGLKDRPKYTTQSDTSGQFQFEFLKEGKYRAVWFRDSNRNSRLDSTEVRFTLTNRPEIAVDTTLGESAVIYIDATEKPVQPELRGVGVLAEHKLRLRFDRIPEIRFPLGVPLYSDSVQVDSVIFLHALAGSPGVVMAQTLLPLSRDKMYSLPSDHPAFANLSPPFPGSSGRDTTFFGMAEITNGTFTLQAEHINVLYTRFSEPFVPSDSVKLLANDGPAQADISYYRNLLQIRPKSGWKPGFSYEVKLYVPSTNTYVSHKPVLHFSQDEGILEVKTDSIPSKELRYAAFEKKIQFSKSGPLPLDRQISLPAGNYFFVLFDDRNADGKWNPANVFPFREGEPVLVMRSLEIKKQFTTELQAGFDL